jgi:hypothetical protein
MQTTTNLFQIVDQAAGADTRIKRGSMGRYDFTIQYHGQEKGRVNYWLEANDRTSESLLALYRFDPQEFETNQRGNHAISLIFHVPPHATLGYYNYTLCLEAAKHPGELVRRHLQIQVITAEEDVSGELEPGFWLEPETTSNQPYQLVPGTELNLTVRIENRSKRVDRFFLTCLDLDEDWYEVKYPESARETLGLVQELDGLPLNPKSDGVIQLRITPPSHAPAGNYFPTIQVTSRNQPNLVLLDVVYFNLAVDAGLSLNLTPNIRHFPTESNEFNLAIQNTGNVPRDLAITACDRDRYFSYQLTPSVICLDPGERKELPLKVTTKKWWKRPFRGDGLEIPFLIEIQNLFTDELVDADELTDVSAIANVKKQFDLPESLPEGQILWKARPRWVLWSLTLLPLTLLILLLLAGIIMALVNWFSRPIPVVTRLEPFQSVYQEGVSQPIRLNWQVRNYHEVERIVITQLEGNMETDRRNFSFPNKNPEVRSTENELL